MKTIVYVDGYNLYHGVLRSTPYKWLDLPSLLAAILREQSPPHSSLQIKFFTSSVLGRVARRGNTSVEAQSSYHKALKAHGVEIIMGRFDLKPGKAPKLEKDKRPDRDNCWPIWQLNEKLTDVQLSIAMYRDVARGAGTAVDQVVLCSNDSDMTPALEAIREDFPGVRRGVILPVRPNVHARKSKRLEDLSHWTRHYIREDELRQNQFPDRVQTGAKPAQKPDHWKASLPQSPVSAPACPAPDTATEAAA